MAVGQKEEYVGPYLPPNYWFWGPVLLVVFGGMSLEFLSLAPRALILSVPLAGLGAYLLYLSFTRTPIKVTHYTLTPEGLLSDDPRPTVPTIHVPWDAMRRIEATPAAGGPLRLHFFASNVTPDNVPAIGRKINEKLFGKHYQRYRAQLAFEPCAQVVELDPTMVTSDGKTFGDQFPIWFAKYAIKAEAG